MQLHTSNSYRKKLAKEEPEIYNSLVNATVVKGEELEEQGLCEMREPEMTNPGEHQGEKREPKLCVHNWPELVEKLKEYHEQEGPFTQEQAEEKIMEQARKELKKASKRARGGGPLHE